MCYSPRLMPSNARYRNIGYKMFNYVPCGECFQCRTRKANAYYVRAFKEFQLYNDPNCLIMFICLTYKEQFLPRVSNDSLDYIADYVHNELDHNQLILVKHRASKNCPWEDQKGTLCNVDFKPLPTFSVDDIHKFFKKLRSRFQKHLCYVPNISYFLVAENGDKKQRPHYHILLFIDLRPSFYYLCKSIVLDSWTVKLNIPHFVPYLNKDGSYKRVKRNGQPYGYTCKTTSVMRGRVFFDEEDGKHIVDPNNPKVSRYLSQYLTTDPYFDTIHHDNLRQLSPRNQKIYRRKFGTFRLCSQFFGFSALWDGSVNKDTAKILLNDCSGHSLDLPRYYYRYIYYSKDDTGRFVRNANYTKLLINKSNERYEALKINFARFYSHIRTGLLHSSMFAVYENQVSQGLLGYPAVYKNVNISLFQTLAKEFTYTELLGYYLILFCVHKKKSQHENYSLPYLASDYLPYTFNHLGDKEYILECMADFYKFQEKAPFIGDDSSTDYFDLRCVSADSLCILFSVWLKFDMVAVNDNKFKDWNEKAKSLGKTKYFARPHAIIEY